MSSKTEAWFFALVSIFFMKDARGRVIRHPSCYLVQVHSSVEHISKDYLQHLAKIHTLVASLSEGHFRVLTLYILLILVS